MDDTFGGFHFAAETTVLRDNSTRRSCAGNADTALHLSYRAVPGDRPVSRDSIRIPLLSLPDILEACEGRQECLLPSEMTPATRDVHFAVTASCTKMAANGKYVVFLWMFCFTLFCYTHQLG